MAQLAVDSFNRANENPLGNGHWLIPTSNANAVQLVSNAATTVGTAAHYCLAYFNIAWPNDQYSEITVGAQTLTAGVFNYQWSGVRMAADGSGYYGFVESTSGGTTHLYIQKHVGVAITNIVGQTAFTVNTGDVLRIEAIGTTILVKVNGVQAISVVDSSLTSGFAGLGLYSANLGFPESITKWAGGNFSQTVAPVVVSTKINAVMW